MNCFEYGKTQCQHCKKAYNRECFLGGVYLHNFLVSSKCTAAVLQLSQSDIHCHNFVQATQSDASVKPA